jgi:hypothetical protein
MAINRIKNVLTAIVVFNAIVFSFGFLTNYVLIDLKRHELGPVESWSSNQLQSAVVVEHQILKQAVVMSYVYLFSLLGLAACNTVLAFRLLKLLKKLELYSPTKAREAP